MNNVSKAALEAWKEKFPKGARVELVSMTDPYTTLTPGDRGTVDHVDDIGTCHITWDNGSTLGAAYGEDEIQLLPPAMPVEVREQILKLRTLPNCSNMFDIHAVQRLAYDNEFFALVTYLEENKKDYANFILHGKAE